MAYIPDHELENLITHGVTHLGRYDSGSRIYCFTKVVESVGYWDTNLDTYVSQSRTWTFDEYRRLWTKLLPTQR